MAVHEVDVCGARVVTGHVTAPTIESSITIAVSVTLPVLVTMNVYGIVESLVCPLSVPDCLSRATCGFADTRVSTESVAVTASPDGGVAVTVAEFVT